MPSDRYSSLPYTDRGLSFQLSRTTWPIDSISTARLRDCIIASMASKLDRLREILQKLLQLMEGQEQARDLATQSARMLAIFEKAKITDENNRNLGLLSIRLDRIAISGSQVPLSRLISPMATVTSVFERLADLLDTEALEEGVHALHALDAEAEAEEGGFQELMGDLVSAVRALSPGSECSQSYNFVGATISGSGTGSVGSGNTGRGSYDFEGSTMTVGGDLASHNAGTSDPEEEATDMAVTYSTLNYPSGHIGSHNKGSLGEIRMLRLLLSPST